jgi:hypothetical protein
MPDKKETPPLKNNCENCKMWKKEKNDENEGLCLRHSFITRNTEECPEFKKKEKNEIQPKEAM